MHAAACLTARVLTPASRCRLQVCQNIFTRAVMGQRERGGSVLLVCNQVHLLQHCDSILRLEAGPSRAKSASRSVRRALLTPWVNAGSLYRCSTST